MNGQNEVKFETIIRMLKDSSGPISITNIYEKDNLTHFTIMGHEFQTFGDKILHRDNIAFDSPVIKIRAAEENTPEGIADAAQRNEECSKELDMWDEHRDLIMQTVFINAVGLLAEGSRKDFIEYVDSWFCVLPEEQSKNMLRKLIEKKKP